jgi:4-hydroxy-3-polyprenylbenzoate decarboxylase
MRKIIVGISGASGIVLGVRALQMLREAGVETHLVMSKSAELTLHHELPELGSTKCAISPT